jgi:hypothetical protein
MNPFKTIFLAFFQPHELERYFAEHPKNRKWSFLIHLFFGLVGCILIWLVSVNNKIFSTDSERIETTGIIILVIYLLIIFLALLINGLFKKDVLLGFIVGTFWQFLVQIILLVSLTVNYKQESPFAIALCILFPIIVICAIIVNIHGRTRGIIFAFIVATIICFVISMIEILRTGSGIVSFVNIAEQVKTGKKSLVVTVPSPKFAIENLFLYRDFTKKYFLYDIEKDSISPCDDHSYMSEYFRYIGITDSTLKILSTLAIPETCRKKLISLRYTLVSPETLKASLSTDCPLDSLLDSIIQIMPVYNDKISIGDCLYGVRNALNLEVDYSYRSDSLMLKGTKPPIAFKLEMGNIITNHQEGYYSRVDTISGDNIDQLLFHNDYLYIQTSSTFGAIDTATGKFIWVYPNEDWFHTGFKKKNWKLNQIFSPAIINGTIYSCSPSGFLFAVSADNGKLLFKKSLNADEIKAFRYKSIVFILLYYLTAGALFSTIIFAIGLYRIPFYLVECLLQFFAFLRITEKPKQLSKVCYAAPLFFDQVSTLPLPFAKRFLNQIIQQNSPECSTALLYLMKKTQQWKFAAHFFNEFHRKNNEHLFGDIYKYLKEENSFLLKKMAQLSKGKNPVEKIIASYVGLVNGEKTLELLSAHIDFLKIFVDEKYKFADELYATYSFLRDFNAIQRLQDLSEVDKKLTDLSKISYLNALNFPIIEIFIIIGELSNDINNFYLADNFRDKQYYLSEARIKLYEISRKAKDELYAPESILFLQVSEGWNDMITRETKILRAPAELELSLMSKTLKGIDAWHPIIVKVKNVGQSPAENVSVTLLDNENMQVLENKKLIHLLGTGELKTIEFSLLPKGNPSELRMYFDVVFNDFERNGKMRPFADIVHISQNIEEFRKIPNPYVVGTPLQNDKVFFGRKNVLDFAMDNLSTGEQNNALIFFGQRRVGKSSILYRLMDSSLKENFMFVYIDCQGFGDADTAKMFYQISRNIQKNATGNRLTLEKPSLVAFQKDPFIAFDEYIDETEKMLGPKKLVLMFDEYEFLEYKAKNGQISQNVFNKFRNLMQHRNKKLAFIFVGTHRLTELTEDYWSFLFNIALYHEIGSLGREEGQALIIEPVKGFIRYDELAVEKILRVSGVHPYFIQVTCRLIVNYCNSRQKNYVTLGDVNEILKEAVEGSTAHVKYLFQDYASEQERNILAFLSRLVDESKHFGSVREIAHMAHEYQFTYNDKDIQEILYGMIRKKLVTQDEEKNADLFGFEIEFMQIWIQEHVKIQNGFISVI